VRARGFPRQTEEGVELIHGRAMTAVLGDGKVEALQLYPANSPERSMPRRS